MRKTFMDKFLDFSLVASYIMLIGLVLILFITFGIIISYSF